MQRPKRATQVITKQLSYQIWNVQKNYTMILFNITKIFGINLQTQGFITLKHQTCAHLRWPLIKHYCLKSGRARGYSKHFRRNRMQTRQALTANYFAEIQQLMH